ncbi:MAG: hypothetical protein LDL14_11070 [Nitrospira sp.]|nr:hypothetical protein [Nitrospira sp.]
MQLKIDRQLSQGSTHQLDIEELPEEAASEEEEAVAVDGEAAGPAAVFVVASFFDEVAVASPDGGFSLSE